MPRYSLNKCKLLLYLLSYPVNLHLLEQRKGVTNMKDLSAELAFFTQKVLTTGERDYYFLVCHSPFAGDLTAHEVSFLVSSLKAQFQPTE